MTTTFIATLVLLLAAAAAQPLPVPKTGVCPSGYASSGSYRVPVSDRAPRAVPKVGACPSGGLVGLGHTDGPSSALRFAILGIP
jgi:hypothetical protein